MSRTKTGREVFPTHSPHHARRIARRCCTCRKEKCCNISSHAISVRTLLKCIEGQKDIARRPEDISNRQLELFDLSRPSWGSSSAAHFAPINPKDMTDEQLLERFVHASVGNVKTLGDELRQRRPTGWQDAAVKLWDRFRGFGHGQPMLEQQVVLSLADGPARHAFVRSLLARGLVSECLEPDLLRAAAACRVPLPTTIVVRGLAHRIADVRCDAVQIALASNVPTEMLLPYLKDQIGFVRREAAIALAGAGEAVAKPSLLQEMRMRPSRAGLEALGCFENEDVVIALGQIARQHPDWSSVVLEVLEMIDHPMAQRVAAGLMGKPGQLTG